MFTRAPPFRIYNDVPGALKGWASEGKKVYTFGAGSVESQKLVVGYSNRGDLQKVIEKRPFLTRQ